MQYGGKEMGRSMPIIFLILAGCSAHSVVAGAGVPVRLNGAESEHLNALAEFYSAMVGMKMPEDWRIVGIDDWIRVPSGEEVHLADGYTSIGTKEIFVYQWAKCPVYNSLAHEMLHMWGMDVHSHPVVKEILVMMEYNAIKLFCPGYSPEYPPEFKTSGDADGQ